MSNYKERKQLNLKNHCKGILKNLLQKAKPAEAEIIKTTLNKIEKNPHNQDQLEAIMEELSKNLKNNEPTTLFRRSFVKKYIVSYGGLSWFIESVKDITSHNETQNNDNKENETTPFKEEVKFLGVLTNK